MTRPGEVANKIERAERRPHQKPLIEEVGVPGLQTSADGD